MDRYDHTIRKASISDLSRLTEIYNQAIDAGYCVADINHFTPKECTPWFEELQNNRYSIFICELDNEVIGYSCISTYQKNNEISGKTGEVCCYIDFHYHGFGIAKKLINHTIQAAKELGYANLCATLLECNRESLALVKRYNFEKFETQPNAVKFGDKYYEQQYYRLSL